MFSILYYIILDISNYTYSLLKSLDFNVKLGYVLAIRAYLYTLSYSYHRTLYVPCKIKFSLAQ